MEELKTKIKELCIDALTTDGAPHKQWFLEEIVKFLGYNLEELNPNEMRWEKGMPP